MEVVDSVTIQPHVYIHMTHPSHEMHQLTLFDGRGRIELGRLDLSFGQVQRGGQQLCGFHIQHQLLHLPV